MRTASVNSVKRKPGRELGKIPKEGTKLRELYDFFAANKGKPVEWNYSINKRAIIDLIDYYGMDIRQVRRYSKFHNKKALYVFAGEWFGAEYVDYIAERMKNE